MNAIRQVILVTAMVMLSVSSGFAVIYVYDDLDRLTEADYGDGRVIRYAKVQLFIYEVVILRDNGAIIPIT